MSWVIHHGDVLEQLAKLPDESVQCCVTSPPYLGLRDYGVPKTVWGGDAACEHQWGDSIKVNATNHTDKRRWNHARNGRGEEQPPEKQVAWLRTNVDQGNVCHVCGAWRGAFGLEPTPEMYVEHAVTIFREVRRVLRPDATLWLNIGDCYATGAGKVGDCPGGGEQGEKWKGGYRGTRRSGKHEYVDAAMGPLTQPNRLPIAGLKPKDLVMIPARVALALQADGWWLRQDIIWSKPNPMPESVTDRCTKAHEYLFLLTKSARYYFDAEAIAESSVTMDIRRPYGSQGAWDMDGRPDEQKHGGEPRSFKGSKFNEGKTAEHQLGRASEKPRKTKVPGGWDRGEGGHGTIHRSGRTSAELGENRNKRSVWTISTAPFPEAHFATFPPKLVEPCILAGCPEGGAVLDPFSGAGTTGLVALRLGRNYIGIELNPEYVKMSKRRITQDQPLFNTVSEAHLDPR